MPWFPTREQAEAFMETITKDPNYTYTVMPNGCGPGWGVEVKDAEGILVTEAYDGSSTP